MKTAGIVLCGGHSKRMGRPKAWLPFADETLLARVVRIVSEVTEPVVVVAAVDQDVPPLPTDVRIVRDEYPDSGPLQGLATGMSALADVADAVYLSACDVPFLRSNFIKRLFELIDADDVCVPFTAGHTHALAAVYRVGILCKVKQLLETDRLSMKGLIANVATRLVASCELECVDPTLESLLNLNSPDDYEKALRISAEKRR